MEIFPRRQIITINKEKIRLSREAGLFTHLIDGIYVDKSLFIKHVIENTNKILLITRPRSFGKSSNMDMLKGFLNIYFNSYTDQIEIRNYSSLSEKYNEKPLKLYAENQINWKELCLVLSGDINSLINSDLDLGYVAWRLFTLKKYNEWKTTKPEILEKYKSRKAFLPEEKEFIGNLLIQYFASGFETLLPIVNNITAVETQVNQWKVSNNSEECKLYEKIDTFFGFMGKNYGTHPVIFLRFGSFGEEDQVSFIKMILYEFEETYDKHRGIEQKLINQAEQGMIDKSPLLKFRSALHENFENNKEGVLKDLIDILYDFYDGRKVWVILENHDYLFRTIQNEDCFRQCQQFFQSMLTTAFNENDKVEKVIITGILDYSKGGMFSGLNDFARYDVLNDTVFHEDFGFTESEVDDLLSQVLVTMDNEEKNDVIMNIKNFYQGYIINNVTLYNPLVINMYCLDETESPSKYSIQRDWKKIGITSLIIESFCKLKELTLYHQLLKEGKMTFQPEGYKTNRFWANEKIYWTMAVDAGCLTSVRGEQNTFQLPNYEIQYAFISDIINQSVKKTFPEYSSSQFKRCLNDKKKLKIFFNNDLLPKISPSVCLDSNFHTLMGSIALLACSLYKETYTIFLEDYTYHQNWLENIFYSEEGADVIIHEYQEIGNSSSLDETMEDTFWNILAYLKMSKPLDLYQQQLNKKWHTITIRGIVLYRNSNQWQVEIKEYSFSILQAHDINQIFNEFTDRENLVCGTGASKNACRAEFLKAIDSNSLENLILSFCNDTIDSNSDDEEGYSRENRMSRKSRRGENEMDFEGYSPKKRK